VKEVTYIRAPKDLSSRLRGFYERVASQLGVDSAYVREVALGESQSALVEEGLRNELTKILQQGIKTPTRHEAQFYFDKRVLLDRLVPFVAAALKRGDAAVIVATSAHQESLLQRLKSDGLDTNAAIKEGLYMAVDAVGALSIFMVNGMPEPARFFRFVGGLIEETAKTGKTTYPRVAVFEESVSVLCKKGQVDAAIRLEQLWNQLAITCEADLLCGYEMSSMNCEEHNHGFKSICAEHSVVFTQRE
jgi:MEDS: MEthanogen/methylotroph, DcmR Sensory domain